MNGVEKEKITRSKDNIDTILHDTLVHFFGFSEDLYEKLLRLVRSNGELPGMYAKVRSHESQAMTYVAKSIDSARQSSGSDLDLDMPIPVEGPGEKMKMEKHNRKAGKGKGTFINYLLSEISPSQLAMADVARAQDLYKQAGRSPTQQMRVAKQRYMARPDPNDSPSVAAAKSKIMMLKKKLAQAELDLQREAERAAVQGQGGVGLGQTTMPPPRQTGGGGFGGGY